MAKNVYIGVSNIAKKIKSMYFGAQVDINSKNLVGNGSFNTGSTGWTSLYPDISFVINTGGYSGNCTRLSIASEPAYPNNNMVLYYFDDTKLFIEGHIYYVSCLCKTSSAMNVILAINDVDSLSRYWLAYSGSKTIGTSWSLVSAVGTAKVTNATTDKPYVGFMLRNIVASGSVYLDEVKVFDLTAIFGAGNEPSQTICDTYLPYGVLLDKARKIKKGYIGVDGIAKLFYNTDPIITSFSSNIFPVITARSDDITGVNVTDSYGTWTIQGYANFNNDGSNNVTYAFDSSTSTYWKSYGGTGKKYAYVKTPNGVSIKPTQFSLKAYSSNTSRSNSFEVYGITEAGTEVVLGTGTLTTSGKVFTINTTTSDYYTRLGVRGLNKEGNTSTFTFNLYYFYCTSGYIKQTP